MKFYSTCNGDQPMLLVFPFNVMAHYIRCLELAKYLKPYFKIKFLYSPSYHLFVTQAGFDTFECDTLDAEKVQRCIQSFDFSWLNERDLNYLLGQQVKSITEQNASAVLGDMSPTLKMAAEKSGVPCFSIINGYMSKYYSYVRRMPRSYPLHSLFNRLPNSLLIYFTHKGESLFFNKMHQPFRNIRKRYGLSAKHSYMQEVEGDVTLLCDLPELFPQNDLPSNYYFIPPLYCKMNDESDEIIEGLDRNKKTLYVSMGSTGNWQKMIFLNNASYLKYNIVTSGDINKIVNGPNVFSYSFINSNKLLELADLVICHGGNGTIYQALSYGIPVLCKTAHLEQEYNVDGLERLQLGKCLDDINNDQDYIEILEEWIEKKNSKELLFIKNKILEATDRFEQIIEDLLNPHFYKNYPGNELASNKLKSSCWTRCDEAQTRINDV